MAKFYYDPVLGLVYWSFEQEKDFDYSKDNKKWVTFDVNKPKMKLRQYISSRAESLASISMAKAPMLKAIFIEAYNIDGLQGVDKVYKEARRRVFKSLNN